MSYNPVTASVSDLVASLSGQTCTLSWTNNSGGVAVQRTIPLATADNPQGQFQTLALLPAGTITYVDSAIQFGSQYTYRVISLPIDDSLPHTQDAGVTVSISLSGTQPHTDSTRPYPPANLPEGNLIDYASCVILNGTSAHPQANVAQDTNPPIVDPLANGLPWNQ